MTRDAPPLIGISADIGAAANAPDSQRAEDSTLFLPRRYLLAVERAGAIPVVLSFHRTTAVIRRLVSALDGLVLSGGDFDIHPRHYGERAIKALGRIKAGRTEFELKLTDAALKEDLPVLGICGGAQTLNVALGGSLYQDIAAQLSAAGACEHTSKNPHGGHRIRVESGTRLFDILQRSSLLVNTRHHQAVKRLGRGLIVNAVADDGVIEGIESTEHAFALGVQWHPEILAKRNLRQRRLFSSFVKFCQSRRRSR
jgi:putative glutamine amidotransferase